MVSVTGVCHCSQKSWNIQPPYAYKGHVHVSVGFYRQQTGISSINLAHQVFPARLLHCELVYKKYELSSKSKDNKPQKVGILLVKKDPIEKLKCKIFLKNIFRPFFTGGWMS